MAAPRSTSSPSAGRRRATGPVALQKARAWPAWWASSMVRGSFAHTRRPAYSVGSSW